MKKIKAKVALTRIKPIKPPVSDRRQILPFERQQNTVATKFTAEVRAEVLTNLRSGEQLATAFNLAGVTTGTIKDWRARADDGEGDPDYVAFFDEVELATANAERRHRALIEAAAQGRPITYDDVEIDERGKRTVVKKTANPDYRAAVFLLQHGPRRKDWIDVDRRELVGKDGGPITTKSLFAEWTEEELRTYSETGRRERA